jgi:ABC-type multidrug transport system fused ATPase/permease subunit
MDRDKPVKSMNGKIRVPTLLHIMTSVLKKTPTNKLYIAVGASALLNAIVLPNLYMRFATKYQVDLDQGIRVLAIYYTVSMFTMGFNVFTKGIRATFSKQFSNETTKLQDSLENMTAQEFRNLSTQTFNPKKNAFNFMAINFANSCLQSLFTSFTLLGTIYVVVTICWPVVILYAIVFYVSFRSWIQPETHAIAEKSATIKKTHRQYYSRARAIEQNKLTSMLHGQREESLDEQRRIDDVCKSERLDRNNSRQLITTKTNILGVAVQFIAVIMYVNMSSVSIYIPFITSLDILKQVTVGTELLVFIGYLNGITSYLQIFQSIYTEHCELDDAYNEWKTMVEELDQHTDYPQIPVPGDLVIRNIRYTKSSEGRIPWTLALNYVCLRPTVCCVVTGTSGSGKTTLLELIAGITGPNEYQGMVSVNGKQVPDKFSSISGSRSICLQDEPCCKTRPLIETITGIAWNDTKHELLWQDTETDMNLVMERVWYVLHIACAVEFVPDCDFLFQPMKPSSLSGGQWSRIKIAQEMYRICESDQSIIIFDEPDKGLQEDLKETIIQKIMRHSVRKGKKLLFTVHSISIHRKWDEMVQRVHGIPMTLCADNGLVTEK